MVGPHGGVELAFRDVDAPGVIVRPLQILLNGIQYVAQRIGRRAVRQA